MSECRHGGGKKVNILENSGGHRVTTPPSQTIVLAFSLIVTLQGCQDLSKEPCSGEIRSMRVRGWLGVWTPAGLVSIQYGMYLST